MSAGRYRSRRGAGWRPRRRRSRPAASRRSGGPAVRKGSPPRVPVPSRALRPPRSASPRAVSRHARGELDVDHVAGGERRVLQMPVQKIPAPAGGDRSRMADGSAPNSMNAAAAAFAASRCEAPGTQAAPARTIASSATAEARRSKPISAADLVSRRSRRRCPGRRIAQRATPRAAGRSARRACSRSPGPGRSSRAFQPPVRERRDEHRHRVLPSRGRSARPAIHVRCPAGLTSAPESGKTARRPAECPTQRQRFSELPKPDSHVIASISSNSATSTPASRIRAGAGRCGR